ncbi:hypothetical protein PBI_DAMIEN_70 [Mycobacterium phage Damien]|uniref:membrane protein n=1 Tax=Mycobacterium phage Damien TaxID=1486469 RepID=UPI00045F742C|nr:membrane protein [Mycobacterium phage Damien]AHZ95431.1 hypothetical protein PBI_DAMIEN_70 [Mycobacterium phage Damien]
MNRMNKKQGAKFAAALAGFAIIGYGVGIVSASEAQGAPECTFSQPYPDNPVRICTDYGQSCSARICAYEPGTPGRWGTDGHYTPKIG